MNTDNERLKSKWINWLKKIGWIGFIFFTVKGLIWLAIIFGVGKVLF